MKIIINTNKGNINLDLFPKKTPLTVANFINLAKRGYYDNLSFHRVIDNFMIQGGCPQGSGMGGTGYQFTDEFHPDLKHDKAGTLSMANSGINSNGSQFFITFGPLKQLDEFDNKSSVLQELYIADISVAVRALFQIATSSIFPAKYDPLYCLPICNGLFIL